MKNCATDGKVIYGVGQTPEAALDAAAAHFGPRWAEVYEATWSEYHGGDSLVVIRASEELARLVEVGGGEIPFRIEGFGRHAMALSMSEILEEVEP